VSEEVLLTAARDEPGTAGVDLVATVTTAAPYVFPAAPGAPRRKILAYDFGIKTTILRHLSRFGEVQVVPANTSAAEVQALAPDGVFLSNGPGDPEMVPYAVDNIRALVGTVPIFGICLGHQMLALAMPDAKVNVSTMGTNTVLLTGTVGAPEDAAEAERLVQAFLGESANVITRLKTATPLQVNLQVKIAEVNRSLLREIGGNLSTIDGTSGFRFGVGTGQQIGGTASWSPQGPLGAGNQVAQTSFTLPDGTTIPGPSVDSRGGTSIAGLGRLFGLNMLGALDLSERLGLVTTISQPNLTALSGETATFLAGGEFPIPIAQGLGQVTIRFREFGVSLAYTPTVLSNGRISLRVRPEVSELTTQGSITLNGFQVPGLTTRRTETTVELGSGQSFMIAGLMSANSQNLVDKAPGLGDVPILGNLFRSREFRRGETELVIIVTPYLVKPVDAKDIRLPTDGFQTANEFQQLLGYQNNSGVSGQERPGPTAAQPDVPVPMIGNADPAALVPMVPQEPRRSERKGRKATREASAATPGFSF
jgi:pilus assembly protein CpaC